MLQGKDIKKISELKTDFTPRWFEPEYILSSLKCFSFSSLCKSLNPIKMKGYSFECIFSILISLPFAGIGNVNRLTNSVLSKHVEAQKDVFYRFKNNSKIVWRMILLLFAVKFRKLVENNCKQVAGPRCLIIDDSVLEKTGKYIEKVSRLWDHVTNSYLLGLKLLVVGYWDGTSFYPLDFSLHRESGKNKEKPYGLKKKEYRKQYRKTTRKSGTHSHLRAKEADSKKTDSAINMIRRAISQGFKVDYLLMDSWFTCDAFIELVKSFKTQAVHLIGMYSKCKTKFGFSNDMYTYSQINNLLGKSKRCRKLRLYYKETIVEYNDIKVKLFFSKQGKNGKWKVFLTTDTRLGFLKMIEIYQIRWTIEVFFKEAKQLLGLGKCQSKDFDAQIADTTIILIQYLLLTLQYRFEHYESKGALFDQIKQEVLRHRLDQRLWGLFIELLNIIEILFNSNIDENEILEKIFSSEKACALLSKVLTDEANIGHAA